MVETETAVMEMVMVQTSLKAIIPIVAAILILGALAIFLGTYLNGINNDNGKELAEKTSQTNSDAKKKLTSKLKKIEK